ncbi:MAG: protein phosphatase 2C domain-containing protein [Bacteroidales bacterium]|nr:protein phosphatase 2C domain-containing protein [Bacteroidales bacterium]
MSNIRFRIAAKTDVGCVRTNNEDNFQAAADLSQQPMRWINNESYDLGPKGALLVVADGMGGMNAGEVASEIAISTIKEFFAPERLTADVTRDRHSINKYMRDVVIEADRRIKASSTVETRGMGTTVVMAWLLDGKCYVCWCGDSRAYIYNPSNGLFQVSKDHSYVQGLVDEGKISEEDAFDFPDSNIITRCLCDAKAAAEPDVLAQPQPLCNGDIILLCSDGLSGMLRDRDMQQIIKAHTDNMDVCADELIAAALRAGGNDNVTVAIAGIEQGGATATPDRVPAKKAPARIRTVTPGTTKATDGNGRKSLPAWIWGLGGLVLAAAIFVGVYFAFLKDDERKQDDVAENTTDVKQDVNTEEGDTYKPDNSTEFQDVVAGKPEHKETGKDKKGSKAAPENDSKKAIENEVENHPSGQRPEAGGTVGTNLKPVNTIVTGDGNLRPVENTEPTTGHDLAPANTITDKKPADKPFKYHTIKRGETLSKIAAKYNCSVQEILDLNPDLRKDQSKIKAGDKIKVPAPSTK